MKSPKLKIKVWKSKDGFRWSMKRCGRIVAESGEGYKRIRSCGAALQHIIDSLATMNYTWDYPK
mgnify:CR=1 FL=1